MSGLAFCPQDLTPNIAPFRKRFSGNGFRHDDRARLAQSVPCASTSTMFNYVARAGECTDVVFNCAAISASEFDGFGNRDAAMLSAKLEDSQRQVWQIAQD